MKTTPVTKVPREVPLSLNAAARYAHETARAKGFWRRDAADLRSKLLLVHSEVTEAAEALRSASDEEVRNGEHLEYVEAGSTKPEGVLPELADVLIRTLDLMYALGANVEGVVRRKMEYNATRSKRHGGKRF